MLAADSFTVRQHKKTETTTTTQQREAMIARWEKKDGSSINLPSAYSDGRTDSDIFIALTGLIGNHRREETEKNKPLI